MTTANDDGLTFNGATYLGQAVSVVANLTFDVNATLDGLATGPVTVVALDASGAELGRAATLRRDDLARAVLPFVRAGLVDTQRQVVVNAADVDGDGDIDCEDSDCEGDADCVDSEELDCDNGDDDDHGRG